MLSLSFLMLIGLTLLVDCFGQHISKEYVYAAMGFSLFVEFLNLRVRQRKAPIELHEPSLTPEGRVKEARPKAAVPVD